MVNYWLMKSEPHVYPFEQLVADGSTHWDGVRNYQARNMMRDDMKMGDFVLFYHSNFKPPHVVGVARVCKEGYPDHTAQDSTSKYFDPKNFRYSKADEEELAAIFGSHLIGSKTGRLSVTTSKGQPSLWAIKRS